MKTIQQLARNEFLTKEIANCDTPICPYCQYGKGHKRSADRNPIITKDIKVPGDLIHMDQAVSSLPGRALTASGKPTKLKYTTISIFVDSISKKIFAEFQETATAEETIAAKTSVEQQAFEEGVKFKRFRANNGIYKSKEFHLNIEKCGQTITFCGVGAHHQNGVAERYIRTIIERARTCLLTTHACWVKHISLDLWILTIQYAVDTWNDTPKADLEWQTPNTEFAGIKLGPKSINK